MAESSDKIIRIRRFSTWVCVDPRSRYWNISKNLLKIYEHG